MFIARTPGVDIPLPKGITREQAKARITNMLRRDLAKGVDRCRPKVKLVDVRQGQEVVTATWDLERRFRRPFYAQLDMQTGELRPVTAKPQRKGLTLL